MWCPLRSAWLKQAPLHRCWGDTGQEATWQMQRGPQLLRCLRLCPTGHKYWLRPLQASVRTATPLPRMWLLNWR